VYDADREEELEGVADRVRERDREID
jgi:hypothetical protein